MTTTSHQSLRRHVLRDATPETLATLSGLEALSDTPTLGPVRAGGPAWNCLEHLPGASIASFVAECLRFGGRRSRQEVARAAYDARWAGHNVGARRDEPWFAPKAAIELPRATAKR